MTTVNKLHAILSVLIEAGKGEEFVEFGHDIAFLSPEPGNDEFEQKMTAAGAHYAVDEGWHVF